MCDGGLPTHTLSPYEQPPAAPRERRGLPAVAAVAGNAVVYGIQWRSLLRKCRLFSCCGRSVVGGWVRGVGWVLEFPVSCSAGFSRFLIGRQREGMLDCYEPHTHTTRAFLCVVCVCGWVGRAVGAAHHLPHLRSATPLFMVRARCCENASFGIGVEAGLNFGYSTAVDANLKLGQRGNSSLTSSVASADNAEEYVKYNNDF